MSSSGYTQTPVVFAFPVDYPQIDNLNASSGQSLDGDGHTPKPVRVTTSAHQLTGIERVYGSGRFPLTDKIEYVRMVCNNYHPQVLVSAVLTHRLQVSNIARVQGSVPRRSHAMNSDDKLRNIHQGRLHSVHPTKHALPITALWRSRMVRLGTACSRSTDAW